MKKVLECVVLLGLTLCLSDNADAQVRQSGNVTPTHAAAWTTPGVIQDAGSSTNPFITTLGVLNGTGTDGLCVQSDKSTAAGYQRTCLGATTSGGAILSVQNFGTAPVGGFQFQVNGTTQAIPTVTLPTVSGNFSCFNSTNGGLIDCGIGSGTFARTDIVNNWTAPCCQGFLVTTQPPYVSSNAIASTAYVQQAIRTTMATVPLSGVTGGTYSFASNGTQGTVNVTSSSGCGSVTSVSGFSSGTGWKVGDLFTLTGSGSNNSDAVLRVLTLSGSIPATAEVLYGGTCYSSTLLNYAAPTVLSSFSLTLTGVLTSNATFVMPKGTVLQQSDQWIVNNNTTGAFSVTVKISNGSDVATGTGVVVQQGSNNSTATFLQTDGVNDIWLGSGLAISPTMTGNWVFQPTSGTGITINTPANSLSRALSIAQTYSGTPGTTPLLGNLINVQSDNVNMDQGAGVFGSLSVLDITHNFGGASMKGTRSSFVVSSGFSTASGNTSDIYKSYVALTGIMTAFDADGGTAFPASTGGSFFGALIQAQTSTLLGHTPTFLTGVVGGEVDVQLVTGTSSRIKFGWNVASYSAGGINDAVQGNVFDGAYAISASTSSVGWKNGLYFTTVAGIFPMNANGTMINADTGTTTNGVDFSNVTFTGSAWKSTGAVLGGSGDLTLTAARTIASATAATLRDFHVAAATTTITGNTGSPITALNKSFFDIPTLTDASAVTVTNAATVDIAGAPTCSGSVTCTNAWALRVEAGDSTFGGRVLPGGYAGSFVPNIAQIYTSAGNGLTIVMGVGSGNDGGFFTPGGAELFVNPHGSNDVKFIGGGGHFRTGNGLGAPTLGTCGTGSIDASSTDAAGTVTATGATSCAVNFKTAYAAAPVCVATDYTTAAGLKAVTATGSVTVSGLTANDVFGYICFARPNG